MAMFSEFWRGIEGDFVKSNLIDLKLRQIEQGAAAVMPIQQMTLPQETTKQGSKIALLLLFKIPNGFAEHYLDWAMRLAFYETLVAKRPDLTMLSDLKDTTEAEFVKLYRGGNRSCQRGHGKVHGKQMYDFYKCLHRYSYDRKRDIIRCLLEAQLTP